ncbi:zinc finger, CCHC-type containing protein, partial [Tanacetum coccineum]
MSHELRLKQEAAEKAFEESKDKYQMITLFEASIENESTALVRGRGCVDLKFSSGKIVSLFSVRKNLVSSSILNNCGYKQVIESNKFVISKHAFMSTYKLNNSIIWHARLGHVHFKRMQYMSKDGLISDFDMDTEKWNKKYFVTFIDDALRFCYVYLLHTKDEALDKFKVLKTEVELLQGSQIKRFRTDRGGEYMDTLYFQPDAIFDENRFSSVPRLSQRSLLNGTEDIDGLVVPEEVIKEVVVQQPEPEHRKSKKNRTPRDFGPKFQLYLIEGIRDDVSYCFNVKDESKTFDEAMKSQDVAFWKEVINDEMDSIMGNNTK